MVVVTNLSKFRFLFLLHYMFWKHKWTGVIVKCTLMGYYYNLPCMCIQKVMVKRFSMYLSKCCCPISPFLTYFAMRLRNSGKSTAPFLLVSTSFSRHFMSSWRRATTTYKSYFSIMHKFEHADIVRAGRMEFAVLQLKSKDYFHAKMTIKIISN